MDTGSGQYLLAKKSIFYIACATAFATLVRPIFADQSILFTYIGVLNSLLSFTLYFYVKQRPNSLHHGYLITLYIFISLVPLLVISGGVNSQYSVIFPIIPIFICLLIHNTKAAWAACAFLSTFVVILLLMESSLPNYTEETVSKQKSNARAFWIVISTFMATLFSVEFNRISHIFNNKLNEQANIDSLTQVANRRSILVTLNTLSKRAKHGRQSYSVMMLDIDYFKKVNDEFGHLIGDKALIHIANLLKS